MARSKINAGDILSIPVDLDTWGYCQVLSYGDVHLFDYFTSEVEKEISKILEKRIIARVTLNVGLEKGIWKKIGHSDVPDAYLESKFYMGDVSDPNTYRVMRNGEIERGFTKEEVVGLARHMIWDCDAIEYRLNRFYHRLPDKYDAKFNKLGWVLK